MESFKWKESVLTPADELAEDQLGALGSDVVFDYLPESMHANIDNLNMLAACLVLDKWTCNVDGRQAVFTRPTQHCRFSAWFIDQGYCFNAGEWSFPDSALRGVHCRNSRLYPRYGLGCL